MEQQESIESRLRKEAAFESTFSRTNLEQGIIVWARSTGIILILSITMNLLGIYAILGNFLALALFGLSFYLLQMAITAEGKKRYNFTANKSAWWSTYWRVIAYVLPVTFVLVSMLPDEVKALSAEQLMNSQAMMIANAIIMFVSIIPTGLATSKALLISYLKQQAAK